MNELDKFYTNKDVATSCISLMLKYTQSCDVFIEPSAGSGNFIFDKTTFAYDILPEGEGIIKENWFDVFISGTNVCVYGNPPYGKRNILSKKFIQHAISFDGVTHVCFLLPSVFKKHTLQAVFPPNWGLVASLDIPDNSFTENGNTYHIPSVFQIWEKDTTHPNLRSYPRTTFSNSHFSIVGKLDSPDLFVLGAAPKTSKLPTEVTPNNRGYYLKSHIPVDILRSNLYNCTWNGNSSASGGVAWLTKTEIMENYEKCIGIT